MTDLETLVAPTGRTVRPVRRFVVAQLVLAVLFGALWWSGLVAPRLRLGGTSGGYYNTITGQASVDLVLQNNSPGAVEVRHVVPHDRRVKVVSVHVNDVDVAGTALTIAGGGEATLKIEFMCRPTPGDESPPGGRPSGRDSTRLDITVRTPVGLERSRTIGAIHVPTECFG